MPAVKKGAGRSPGSQGLPQLNPPGFWWAEYRAILIRELEAMKT